MRTVFGADEQSDIDVDVLRWVRLARMVLDEERVPEDAELSVIFVDEQAMSDLNERFLGGSGPTDVLAFPMDEDVAPGGRQPDQGGRGPGSPSEPGEAPSVLGDVVVCPQVAKRQANGGRASLDDEVALLVVHGVLHLLNYDHAEEQETEAMRKRESELLDRFRDLEQEADR
ncbi:MAG: rRNA maturation RNase YbeY [Actinomycetota bacterium]|jgi:probable rRNA maturation factor|nr:rRNA maturation RNase YbeY [Actinomycetota bacterium]